jgi:hypothetical protein
MQNPDGSFGSSHAVYETSMTVIALVAAARMQYKPSNSNLKGIIEKAKNYLIEKQQDEGEGITEDNLIYGGWGYPREGWADLSNTQFALMALDAAYNFLRIPKNDNVWNKAQKFISNCQQQDGGFIYKPDWWWWQSPYGSMTAAGIWSLRLCNIAPSDPRIQNAIIWLTNNYSVDSNPGLGSGWYFYYLMSFAKAMAMCNYAYLGGHNWYNDIVERLKNIQNEDGSWSIDNNEPPIMATIWAILALETRFVPLYNPRYLVIVLHSDVDLHVYDPEGNHVGLNYETGEVEVEIPGTEILETTQDGIPIALRIHQPLPGSYLVQLKGRSKGTYTLTIEGIQGDIVTSSNSFTKEVNEGEVQSSTVVVSNIEGVMTVFSEEPRRDALMEVIPKDLHFLVPIGVTNITTKLKIYEKQGEKDIVGINLILSDLTDSQGNVIISAKDISMEPSSLDVSKGQSSEVNISFNLPSTVEPGLLCSGRLRLESLNAGAETINISIIVTKTKEFKGLSIISLPADFEISSPKDVFGKDVKIAIYDPKANDYIKDPNQINILNGYGYWIKSEEPVQMTQFGILTDQSKSYAIKLHKGWNLIGVPFLDPIEWNTSKIKVKREGELARPITQALDLVEDYAWGWEQDKNDPNSGRYVLVYDTSVIPNVVGQLEPWKGYWVYAHTDCELILPPPSQSKGRGTRGEGRVAKGNGWSMRLQASVNVSVGEAVIGIANGTRGLAVGLPPEPPTGNNGVQVILLKNNTPLAVDVRSDGARRQEWEVLVRWDKGQVTRGMGERKEVVLTFDGIGYAPKDVSAWLVDTVTGKRLYLRTQPSYRFVAQEGEVERKFKVVVERGNDRPLRVVGLKATPMRGQGVVIEFSLTKPAKVEAEVLTLTGRRVAILDAGSSEGLARRIVWRGVGIEGQKVGGGVYLVRVRAVDEEGREVQAATIVRLR